MSDWETVGKIDDGWETVGNSDGWETVGTTQKPVTKTKWTEDVGIGIEGLGHVGKDAWDMLAGGAASVFGDTAGADKIYADMEARNKAWEEEMKTKDQGLSGQIISGISQIAPAVAAIPFVGPAPAMGILAGMSALSQGGRNVRNGADAMTQALPQAVGEAAMDMTAAKFIPGGKGIMQGMAYGAGGNLASQVGQDVLATQTLPEKAQEAYAPDLNKYIVSGVTGALPGAVIGHMTPKGVDAPAVETPPAPEGTPPSTVSKISDQIKYSQRMLDSMTAQREELTTKLEEARTENQSKYISESIEAIDNEIYKLEMSIKNLSEHPDIMGKDTPVELAPRTDVEGPTRPEDVEAGLPRTPEAELAAVLRAEQTREQDNLQINQPPEPPAFVPGSNRVEAHNNFKSQIQSYADTGKFSTESIDSSIEARQARIDKFQDAANQLNDAGKFDEAAKFQSLVSMMEQENTSLQKVRDLPANVRQEAFKIIAKHLENVDYNSLPDQPTLTPDVTTELLQGIVQHGTLRQGLKTIADSSPSPVLRTIANLLHNNKRIGGFVKLYYDSKLEHQAAAYQRDTVELAFRNEGAATDKNIIHEGLHAATSGMMYAIKAGFKFAPEVHKAYDNIMGLNAKLKGELNLNFVNAIYTELQLQNKLNGIPDDVETMMAQAKQYADGATKNERELLAYGLSEDLFVGALNRIELAGEKSLAKQLYKSIATMLGFGNKEATTALQVLLDNSQVLIEQSEGKSYKQITGKDITAEDFSKDYRTPTGDIGLKSSNKFIQGLYDFGAGFGRRFFITPDNLANYYKHPLIEKVSNLARQAEMNATSIFNEVMTGNPSREKFEKHWKGKLFSMSKAIDERGLEYVINNTSTKEIGGLARLMPTVIRDGLTWEAAVQEHLPTATEKQRNFAKAMDRANKILLDRENEMLTARGLPPIIDSGGYVIKNLVGRFYADTSYNGEVFERQHFLSQKEAEAYAKRVMQADKSISVSVTKKDPKANNDNITETLQEIIDMSKAGVNADQYTKAKLATITAKASGIGGHKMHRGLAHNFMGGLETDAQLGKAFADSLAQGVGEYTNSGRLRQIAADTAQDMHGIQSEKNKILYPNAYKVAQYFLDNEMNRLEHNKFTESIAPLSDLTNETLNNVLFDVTGRHVSTDFITKSWQELTRVAYNLKLTSAPVTWLAQALATMQISRGVFKEGAGFIDGMGGISKGILKTIFKQYDDDAIRGLYHVSQTLDTFHKHTINDSTIGQMSKKTSFDEFRKWVLGEKFTEGSDSFSRIAAYNVAYETLKSMGWKAGSTDTYEQAAKMATDNMIAMGRKHLPGVYKELGFVGTTQAPLRGFMHGAFANLAVDVKDIVKNPNKANSLALTANMLSILIMGGVLGAPFLADYEYLRQLLVKSGVLAYDALPNWTEVAEKMPNWASRGIISDLTGVDVGASSRYNSIFKPFGEVAESSGLADLSLQAGTIGDLASGGWGLIKDTLGSQSDEAARVNWNKVLPRGPAKAIKEEMYDYRDASVAGTRGDKLVARGPTERAATMLGSSSIAESKARAGREQKRVIDEQLNAKKQKIVDLILSPNPSDKDAGRKMVSKMVRDNNITPEEARSLLMGRVVERNRNVLERMMANKQGGTTTKPQVRSMRDLYPYLQE